MPTVLKVTTKVMNTEVTQYTTGFKGGKSKNHKGIDLIPKSTSETPEVLAYDAGTVIQVQNLDGVNESTKNPGMGTSVAIKHADGTVTRYQHLKYNSLKVKKGDKVVKGQVLGLYGRPTNGNSTGPHLHWDISLPVKPSEDSIKSTFCGETRYYVDPIPYLTRSVKHEEKIKYKVNASALRVRKGAGLNYDVLTTIKRDTVVTVYEVKNGWGRIDPSAAKWCSMEYLKKV